MSLALFAHPFSSYAQKALIPLYENGTAFDYRSLDPSQPANYAELEALWPLKKFPLLLDDGRVVTESTIIIEHLDVHHPGPVRMIPDDPAEALEARFMDRFFDNYLQTPFQSIVGDRLREPADRSVKTVADARVVLEKAYAWLETRMEGRQWAAGDFGLADCSAAPALFYADWTHPIDARFKNLHAYRARLNARPSYAQAIEEARPYRHFFPLGAPDRD